MITFLVLALACGTSMHAADRTVPCASAVQSPKRGLAVQGNDYPSGITLNQADVDALSPGVLWYYIWAASTTVPDAQQRMAFVPMAWGRNGDNTNVQTWLNAHSGTPVVLSANEPNLAEQANLSVADAASFIQGTRTIAGSRSVVGAHLAASATTTAYRNTLFDELEDLGDIMPATRIHIYDPSIGGFGYWASEWPHEDWNAGQTPPSTVWVKEFNHGNETATESTVIDVMIQAVDLMERDPRVERYAWWKDRRRTGTRPATHFMLNQTQNGVLTTLGSIYVNMPVHDPTLYYGLPSGATGRLEIER